MAIIGLAEIGHYYGDNCVFKDVSFSVEKEHRIGLVGHNGSGKTTLLEIIAGIIMPSQGVVHRQRDLQIAYLQQTIEVHSEISLFDYVLTSHQRLSELTHLIKELEWTLKSDHSAKNLRLLDEYHNEFTMLEGYSLETKVETILQQLSFTKADWERRVNSFSGGEKTRIQLAVTLVSPADLLLLDEPTNHLDIKMRDWLESYLNEVHIPYIIVSHDRHFLERTATSIVAFENKTTATYSGRYSFFEAEYQLKQRQQLKAYAAQQTFIEKTEDFVRRNLAGQKTKQAQSRRKMLAKLDRVERPHHRQQMNLSISASKRSGNIVYLIDEVTFGFPNKILGKHISETVYYQDRIAILGENGCGKTTFLQVMTGERRALKGRITQGANLSIGYYDQLHINLDSSLTVGQTISSKHQHWTRYEVMSYLARYGFYEEDFEKSVNMLSGGEKARLLLAVLISTKPNLLIMDEPTNHLDIFMIQSVEEALADYDGTIIFVSHDRYFINNVADRVWLFKDKSIIDTNRWEELILEEVKEKKEDSGESTDTRQQRTKKQTRVNPLLLEKKLKQIEEIEDSIASKEEKINELQLLFCVEETMKDGDKVKEISRQVAALNNEIKSLTNELTALEDEYLRYLERT